MSLSELLPAVGSLSRLDKLRLIRWLAVDLSEAEGSASAEEVESETRDDDRLQEAIHAVALRNAASRQGEEGPRQPGENGTGIDQRGSPPTVASQSYPYWSPDRDHEAAELLMKLLEAEKPAS